MSDDSCEVEFTYPMTAFVAATLVLTATDRKLAKDFIRGDYRVKIDTPLDHSVLDELLLSA